MSDEIDTLLSRFELKSRVFFSGQLCGLAHFDDSQGSAHLHVLQDGTLDVLLPDGVAQSVQAPAVLFFPRATPHRLRAPQERGTTLICASVACETPLGQRVMHELPAMLTVPLQEQPGLHMSLQLLFDEAFAKRQGREAALNRLSELVLIHLFRQLMAQGRMKLGILGALSDPRLARALHAIHTDAAKPWTLEQLALVAGMSRARFAAQFTQMLGQSPGDYLASWRIGLAQTLLSKGRQVKHVADAVGYGSASALTRAFALKTGKAPMAWLAGRRELLSAERLSA